MSDYPHDLPGDFDDTTATLDTTDETDTDDETTDPSAPKVDPGTLTVTPPDGAEFVFAEVKTDRGTRSLGNVPILRWVDTRKAEDFYGTEAFLDAFNDTGLRVPFQAIARRGRASGTKTDDQIAQEQINYRPGSRAQAPSTPASRAKRAAAAAAEKLGDRGDVLVQLMQRIASGQITDEDLAKLSGNQ